MAPEQLSRVVQPFQQADASTTRRFGGSGLGLSICRELVALLHGDFAYASSPGVGSAFVVAVPCEALSTATHTSPVAGPPPARAASPSSSTAPGRRRVSPPLAPGAAALSTSRRRSTSPSPVLPTAIASPPLPVPVGPEGPNRMGVVEPSSAQVPVPVRPTVLVADDNPLNIRVILRQLERCGPHGYDAAVACNGAECVDMAQRFLSPVRPAGSNGDSLQHRMAAALANGAAQAPRLKAVLMDLNMPVMDGLEATRQIRAMEAAFGVLPRDRVPIIALTADDPQAVGDACRDAGMTGFLRKPVILSDLRDTLEGALLAR